MVKPCKNLLLQNPKSYDPMKLGMQHRGLKLYKICINGNGKVKFGNLGFSTLTRYEKATVERMAMVYGAWLHGFIGTHS